MTGVSGEPQPIHQRFQQSRFGWYVHTRHGIAVVGEVPIFSFTRRGAERKAARLVRRLRRREAYRLASTERLS